MLFCFLFDFQLLEYAILCLIWFSSSRIFYSVSNLSASRYLYYWHDWRLSCWKISCLVVLGVSSRCYGATKLVIDFGCLQDLTMLYVFMSNMILDSGYAPKLWFGNIIGDCAFEVHNSFVLFIQWLVFQFFGALIRRFEIDFVKSFSERIDTLRS